MNDLDLHTYHCYRICREKKNNFKNVTSLGSKIRNYRDHSIFYLKKNLLKLKCTKL